MSPPQTAACTQLLLVEVPLSALLPTGINCMSGWAGIYTAASLIMCPIQARRRNCTLLHGCIPYSAALARLVLPLLSSCCQQSCQLWLRCSAACIPDAPPACRHIRPENGQALHAELQRVAASHRPRRCSCTERWACSSLSGGNSSTTPARLSWAARASVSLNAPLQAYLREVHELHRCMLAFTNHISRTFL